MVRKTGLSLLTIVAILSVVTIVSRDRPVFRTMASPSMGFPKGMSGWVARGWAAL